MAYKNIEYQKEYHRKYYLKNKEKLKEYHRKYWLDNKEKNKKKIIENIG